MNNPKNPEQPEKEAVSAIIDLRTAIDSLKKTPGQLLVCNEPAGHRYQSP